MLDRAYGEKIHFSVATAIPFEEKIMVDTPLPANELWINVYTLFRNYHGSFEDVSKVDRAEFVNGFIEEAQTILVQTEGVINTFYYQTDLSLLPLKMKHAKVKTPHTKKQLIYSNLERMAIEALVRNSVPVTRCKLRLPKRDVNAWVITHHPLDLLSRYQFLELTLLESHTGELKPQHKWNTKLSKNEMYKHIPFNLLSMQVLGDRGNLFYALGSAHKKALVQLSELGKWTPTTTRDKILFDLPKLDDKEMQATFKAMLQINLT